MSWCGERRAWLASKKRASPRGKAAKQWSAKDTEQGALRAEGNGYCEARAAGLRTVVYRIARPPTSCRTNSNSASCFGRLTMNEIRTDSQPWLESKPLM